MTPAHAVLCAIATTVVPEATGLDATQWDEVERIIARAIAARAPGLRRSLALYLALLEWLPLLRYGRRFSKLDAERRTRWLARLQAIRSSAQRSTFARLRPAADRLLPGVQPVVCA